MKWLNERDDLSVFSGPQAYVDWKGICEQMEALQRQFDALSLPLSAENLMERFGCSGRDYGVGDMFQVADTALAQHGYEIVQADTGGDFYQWKVVPLSDPALLALVDFDAVERDQQPEDVQ